jgi:hypothetical protein
MNALASGGLTSQDWDRLALRAESPVLDFPVMAKTGEELAALRERVDGAITYGKIAFAASWVAIGFLVFYYFPSVVDSKIGERLRTIEETQRLLLQKFPDLLPQYLNSANRKDASDKLRVATQVLNSAKAHKLQIPTSGLEQTNAALLLLGENVPDTRSQAWSVAVQLADYRSFLNASMTTPSSPAGQTGECVKMSGPGLQATFTNDIFEDCRQTLDHGVWKNTRFVNSVIFYNGGPVELDGVTFENCIFHIADVPNARTFLSRVISSNPSTIKVG